MFAFGSTPLRCHLNSGRTEAAYSRMPSSAAQQIDGTPEVEIRSASLSDAAIAAELIYLPMGSLGDYLFGGNDSALARQVLRKLFVQPENRFSYRLCDVLTVNDEVTALLLSYPAENIGRLAIPTGKDLRQIIGWMGILRVLRSSIPLLGEKEAEPDEYYIYTLAVRPELQNQGLGKRLLDYAETKARAAGLRKCSLGVTLTNERARRFYERHGYQVVQTVETPRLEKPAGYRGYCRMVKHLP